MANWLDQAKGTSVLAAGGQLGLRVHGRSLSPCPGCGEEVRSRREGRRGPVGVKPNDTAWHCFRCQSMGDVIDLASYCLCGGRFRSLDRDGMNTVRAWFEDQGFIPCRPGFRSGACRSPAPLVRRTPDVRLPVYPEPEQLRDLWRRCDRPNRTLSRRAKDWLKARGLDAEALSVMDVARITPKPDSFSWPKWWPKTRTYSFRLVTLGFDATDGRARGLHARSINENSKGKTRWHNGTAKGLVFANPAGRNFLRTKETDADTVLVVEGATDFWWACQFCYLQKLPWLVFGCTNGNFETLASAGLPRGLDIVAFPDPDEDGDRYAMKLAAALPDHRVVRAQPELLPATATPEGAADVRPT